MNLEDKINILIKVLTSDIPFSSTTYDKVKAKLVDLLLEL